MYFFLILLIIILVVVLSGGGVTCGGGLTLFCLNIVVLAAWTRAEEGAVHVHTLGFSTHTAQLTLIHICAEERAHNDQ